MMIYVNEYDADDDNDDTLTRQIWIHQGSAKGEIPTRRASASGQWQFSSFLLMVIYLILRFLGSKTFWGQTNFVERFLGQTPQVSQVRASFPIHHPDLHIMVVWWWWWLFHHDDDDGCLMMMMMVMMKTFWEDLAHSQKGCGQPNDACLKASF